MEIKHLSLTKSQVMLNLANYDMKGEPVINQTRKLNDIPGIFKDEKAYSEMDQEQLVCTVQSWLPVADGTTGGLFFWTSTIYPGKAGNEYFITKGLFHLQGTRAGFCWGVPGNGMLILKDCERYTLAEEVYPGILYYDGGEIAHRLANTGDEKLGVGACWPSEAGHDYEEIELNVFSARLVDGDGLPNYLKSNI